MSNANPIKHPQTKAELREYYSVSPRVLRVWVRKLSVNRDCPFQYHEYSKLRILPPVYVNYIISHLG